MDGRMDGRTDGWTDAKQISKEESFAEAGTKVSGNHTQVSKSPPVVKSHRMCLIALATGCYGRVCKVHRRNSAEVRFFFLNCKLVSQSPFA